MFSRKIIPKVQKIGISENELYYCCVRQVGEQFQTLWYEKSQQLPLISFIQQQWELNHFMVISSIPYPFIWRKYLFFPLHYSPQAIYIQIIDYLKKHLPLPLSDIYFDYQQSIFTDKEAIRIIIYAVKKEYANQYLIHHNTILDCELFCFIRGFQEQSNIRKEDAIYKIDNHYVQFKFDELCINNQKPKKDYLSLNKLTLINNILNPQLYITALGAYLWNGEESI